MNAKRLLEQIDARIKGLTGWTEIHMIGPEKYSASTQRIAHANGIAAEALYWVKGLIAEQLSEEVTALDNFILPCCETGCIEMVARKDAESEGWLKPPGNRDDCRYCPKHWSGLR